MSQESFQPASASYQPPTNPKPRKVLEARNWFFLALKVFGYNLLGYLIIALSIGLIVVVAGGIADR